MATDFNPATGGGRWLSADDIAALSGGRASASTVRAWWRNKMLPYQTFPELGKKSNRRSHHRDVEAFLCRKYGQVSISAVSQAPTEQSSAAVRRSTADLTDTLLSVKAAAAAAMDSLISEAEAHAAVARAVAEAETKHVESLKSLRTMLRGYDLALGAHIQTHNPIDPTGQSQGWVP